MKSHRRHWTQWLKSNCGISRTCRNPSVWGWCNKSTRRNQWNWCSAMWAKVRTRRLKLVTLETAAAQAKPFPPRRDTGRRSPLFFNFQCLCNVFIYNWTAFCYHSAPGTARLLCESCWKCLTFHDSNSVMHSPMCVNVSCCGMQRHIRHITSHITPLNMPFSHHPKLKAAVNAWHCRTHCFGNHLHRVITAVSPLNAIGRSKVLTGLAAWARPQSSCKLMTSGFLYFSFSFLTFFKREVSKILDIIIIILLNNISTWWKRQFEKWKSKHLKFYLICQFKIMSVFNCISTADSLSGALIIHQVLFIQERLSWTLGGGSLNFSSYSC